RHKGLCGRVEPRAGASSQGVVKAVTQSATFEAELLSGELSTNDHAPTPRNFLHHSRRSFRRGLCVDVVLGEGATKFATRAPQSLAAQAPFVFIRFGHHH